MRLPLDAAVINRLWQTRVRSSLDADVAYARPTQRTAWAIGSMADAADLYAQGAQCSAVVDRSGQNSARLLFK
ncbi:hypothetical protein GW17_00060410 [Ensete ventricosum]|nr:hypothetical protein GW17_00060410 [Ensete ventricosum]